MNEAVAGLVDDYVEQHAKFAFQEFNVLRVARDQMPGDALDTDSPLAPGKLTYRDTIREEIGAFKRDHQEAFRTVFEAVADDDTDIEEGITAAVEHDPFYRQVDDGVRDAMRADLADYLTEVGEAMRPLLVAEGDDAWDVVTAVCDRDEAERRLTSITHHADVYSAYIDDIVMAIDFRGLDLFGDVVDYSDEALRIVDHGEDYLRRVIASDVDDAFDVGDGG